MFTPFSYSFHLLIPISHSLLPLIPVLFLLYLFFTYSFISKSVTDRVPSIFRLYILNVESSGLHFCSSFAMNFMLRELRELLSQAERFLSKDYSENSRFWWRKESEVCWLLSFFSILTFLWSQRKEKRSKRKQGKVSQQKHDVSLFFLDWNSGHKKSQGKEIQHAVHEIIYIVLLPLSHTSFTGGWGWEWGWRIDQVHWFQW